jgi:ribosomal protein S12 methylthiotransferase accessory factor
VITDGIAIDRLPAEASVAPEHAAVLSPDAGIVHRIDEALTSYDHPRLAPAFAQSCNTGPVFGVRLEGRAGAMADDPLAAQAAAAGEAVERYSACHLPTSRLRTARAAELSPAPIVAPLWMRQPEADQPITWMPAVKLRTDGRGAHAWVASSRAFLLQIDDQPDVATPTSTGLASHPDPWRALYSALLEVIERDAVMITWLTRGRVVPVRTGLSWTTPAGRHIRFDRSVEQYHLFLLDSPTDVPVVFAVALGGPGQPAMAVGAAAHLHLAHACRKALVEAHQTMHWATGMLAGGRSVPATPDELDDFDDHVAYYLDADRLRAVDFLLNSDVEAVCVDLAGDAFEVNAELSVRTVVEMAAHGGVDCYAVDVTAPDLREAGLWVIRAVSPQLYPLLVGSGPRPDHPRLPASAPVNPDPHPFP